MNSIILASIIVTIGGILGAVVLVLAAQFMHVEEDERIGLVNEVLPGANCGACGYAGCADYAKAVVENGAPTNSCVPGGGSVASDVAKVMGVEAGEVVSYKAVVACQGSYAKTSDKYDYMGIESCKAVNTLFSGRSACKYGCLGYGDCASVCKFGAIEIKNGLAKINKEKCTGCGACARACPNHIIWVLPESDKPVVLCANKDRGALTRKACTAGCIGCMKCQKTCPNGAITVVDNVAHIDESKCVGCGECVAVCPVHAICLPHVGEE